MNTPNLLASLGILVLLAVLIAAGALWIRAVREDIRPTRPGSLDLLRDLEAAYRKGQMDTAEFERVRQSLDNQATGGPMEAPRSAGAPVPRGKPPAVPPTPAPHAEPGPPAGPPVTP